MRNSHFLSKFHGNGFVVFGIYLTDISMISFICKRPHSSSPWSPTEQKGLSNVRCLGHKRLPAKAVAKRQEHSEGSVTCTWLPTLLGSLKHTFAVNAFSPAALIVLVSVCCRIKPATLRAVRNCKMSVMILNVAYTQPQTRDRLKFQVPHYQRPLRRMETVKIPS